MEVKKENLQTVKDYANKNNITVQAVYQGIKAGRLKSKKIGNFVFVVITDKS